MSRVRWTATAACLVALICLGPAVAAEDDTVALRWALGALDTTGSQPSAIQRDTELAGGTRLKFLVEPLSAGSVYLILLDSSDAIQVLYRATSPAPAGDDPTYIPPGSHWFALDDEAGMETFFLLASKRPLTELEQLLDRHEAGETAVAGAIVDEIRRLNKANRELSRPVEKPVMIGGQTRGGVVSASAIDRLAVEVEAESFYGKTITIDH